MGTGEGFTMRNFIVFTDHLVYKIEKGSSCSQNGGMYEYFKILEEIDL